ncbi:electron transfer flavoprotein subunit beta/FixA family protein [Clostridium luticellarii]|uniref:Electron transfer flavoprotein small subunit n=1 Tax=Clostridium luticellarii TaxID=1691940 RepID=A0A2T0BMB3_9CLOT|nr:electron transfer flavoprotein subunit beta/FixA family protein [Clostridium luticellarii]MCI1945210.1 electron transfer flavoprotein subunit beta/FixA family protein [Clostridium luticellarii]MCI1968828.1 electron transfer flavoprotein subunit beta/FixA family protein [Clostridium luticellarii]MCI1995614.1 electron transfer flavoprotein subunit beta/FixA family protein [Clostridium luticellarii]PRR85019.1 Acryloyl-CoA reductase electron transfer subunit gamma [Clostridium luticellarii]
MNILVCVKQVPSTTEIKLDPETHTIIRDRNDNIINPLDTYAIEEALRLKEKYGGKITAISMGIPRVKDMLREVISLGVDRAILLSDRKFAGSDTLATAYALEKAIKKVGDYDLIICGKQATDGDTAQVGPNLAEKLGIPHTTYVSRIDSIENNRIICRRNADEGYVKVQLRLPALITVVKEINVPRLSTIAGLRKSISAKISVWDSSDIGASDNFIGLTGSPTQVRKTFVPDHNIKTEFLNGTSHEQAEALAKKLMIMDIQ